MITVLSGAADPSAPMVLHSNALARGSLVASSAAPDGAVQNLLGPQTFDYWVPSAMPATVTVTLPTAEAADALAICAHDLGSKGVTVALSYSVTTSSSFIPVGSVTPPAGDNTAFLMVFPPVTGRRFQLTFTGATAPAVGIAMVGARLVFPADVAPPYRPLAYAQRVEVIGAQSLAGQHIGNRKRTRAATGAVNLSPMPRAFLEGAAARAFADRFNGGDPFFWAANPAGLPADCVYAWRAEGAAELVPELQPGARLMAMQMELEAYV